MTSRVAKEATDLDRKIGALMRAARRERKLSQSELGERIGLTFQQVQKYEKGVNRIPAGRLWEISVVLEKPIGYFFREFDSETAHVVDNDPLQSFGVARYALLMANLARISDTDICDAVVENIQTLAELGERQKSQRSA